MRQPMRNSALRTRRAFAARHWLMPQWIWKSAVQYLRYARYVPQGPGALAPEPWQAPHLGWRHMPKRLAAAAPRRANARRPRVRIQWSVALRHSLIIASLSRFYRLLGSSPNAPAERPPADVSCAARARRARTASASGIRPPSAMRLSLASSATSHTCSNDIGHAGVSMTPNAPDQRRRDEMSSATHVHNEMPHMRRARDAVSPSAESGCSALRFGSCNCDPANSSPARSVLVVTWKISATTRPRRT